MSSIQISIPWSIELLECIPHHSPSNKALGRRRSRSTIPKCYLSRPWCSARETKWWWLSNGCADPLDAQCLVAKNTMPFLLFFQAICLLNSFVFHQVFPSKPEVRLPPGLIQAHRFTSPFLFTWHLSCRTSLYKRKPLPASTSISASAQTPKFMESCESNHRIIWSLLSQSIQWECRAESTLVPLEINNRVPRTNLTPPPEKNYPQVTTFPF